MMVQLTQDKVAGVIRIVAGTIRITVELPQDITGGTIRMHGATHSRQKDIRIMAGTIRITAELPEDTVGVTIRITAQFPQNKISGTIKITSS